MPTESEMAGACPIETRESRTSPCHDGSIALIEIVHFPSISSYALKQTAHYGTSKHADAGLLSINYLTSFFGDAAARRLLALAGLSTDYGALPSEVTRSDFWQMCLDSINLHGDEGHGCTVVDSQNQHGR